mmetsp:Transcript_12569/g.19315  ORF Transcript_12569/g.19315 Transcript_12569/m.19315 type:complete len:207 (-) Transcript_12569:1130-1750(-)
MATGQDRRFNHTIVYLLSLYILVVLNYYHLFLNRASAPSGCCSAESPPSFLMLSSTLPSWSAALPNTADGMDFCSILTCPSSSTTPSPSLPPSSSSSSRSRSISSGLAAAPAASPWPSPPASAPPSPPPPPPVAALIRAACRSRSSRLAAAALRLPAAASTNCMAPPPGAITPGPRPARRSRSACLAAASASEGTGASPLAISAAM